MLAMQPSTGEILAVAQNAAANAQGAPALTGQYPPGSTFKVVTATAGLDRGLIAPGQPVACPGAFEIDGRVIHNSHDFALGTVDSTLAFAKSCNTTFASLATQMPADALPDGRHRLRDRPGLRGGGRHHADREGAQRRHSSCNGRRTVSARARC